MAVQTVGTVAQRNTAFWISPGDLSTRAIVAEHKGGARMTEAAVGPVRVTGDDDAQSAIGALVKDWVLQRAAPHLARHTDHVGIPDLQAVGCAPVGQEGLVEER